MLLRVVAAQMVHKNELASAEAFFSEVALQLTHHLGIFKNNKHSCSQSLYILVFMSHF